MPSELGVADMVGGVAPCLEGGTLECALEILDQGADHLTRRGEVGQVGREPLLALAGEGADLGEAIGTTRTRELVEPSLERKGGLRLTCQDRRIVFPQFEETRR